MCALPRQTDLPLDGLPPGPDSISAAAASRALRIVVVGAAPLGKTQQKFNKLVARIENLRVERTRALARWDAALGAYARTIHPLETRIHDLRRDLAFELAKLWRAPKGLGKRQRSLLRDLLLLQFEYLQPRETGSGDAGLRTLYDELREDARAEEKADEEKHGGFGPPDEADDVDDDDGPAGFDRSKLRPDMSPEEILAEMARQAFENGGAGASPFGSEGNSRPHKPTASQARKQKREAELEEARKRGVATIYKQLAKVLHPDLEQDPGRRQEKERLMQELTAAYRAGDLHTLLRLELEFIHREQGDLNHLGEEKLKIYCELLAEQADELERGVAGVAMEPRYGAIRQYAHPFYTRTPDWAGIEADLADQGGSLARSLAALRGPGARAELRDALKTFADQRRRAARRPDFQGFF